MFQLIPDENPTRDPVPELEIRSADAADIPGIIAVWRSAFGEEVFGGTGIIDKWLAWGYDDNPSRPPGAPNHKIGLLDGLIVSVVSRQYVFIRVRGDRIMGTWGQNLATDSAYQRRGISASMARLRFAAPDLSMGVGRTAAGLKQNRSNQRARARDHFTWPDTAHFGVFRLRWPKLVRAAVAAVRHGKWGDLGQLLRNGVSLAIQSVPSNAEVVAVEQFDERVDALLAEVETDIPVMVERSREKLNWFLRNPRIEMRAFTVSTGAKLRGYALLRSDGMILDLLVGRQDPEAFDALMGHIVKAGCGGGAPVLTGIVPSVPCMRVNYRRWGFTVDPKINFGFSFQFFSGARDPRMEEPTNWYLSMSDCDLWSFRPKY